MDEVCVGTVNFPQGKQACIILVKENDNYRLNINGRTVLANRRLSFVEAINWFSDILQSKRLVAGLD